MQYFPTITTPKSTLPDLSGYVPYTGATASLNLGAYDLTATKGRFTTGLFDNEATPKLAIDLGVRKLYASDGTTVMMNFANAWGTSTNPSLLLAGAGNETMTGDNNYLIGYQAGKDITSGGSNFFVGNGAGTGMATGSRNTMIGEQAGAGIASGSSNMFVAGYKSGYGLSGTINNMFVVGYEAGLNGANGYNATLIGNSAGYGASGFANSFFANLEAGKNTVNCSDSVFIGNEAGEDAQGAYNSFFFGRQAGKGSVNAYFSIFLGGGAGFQNSGGYQSVKIGQDAGYSASGTVTTRFATFIGYSAGKNADNALGATIVGALAGEDATYSNEATFVGYLAGKSATYASRSLLLGFNSGNSATYSTEMISVGNFAGYQAYNSGDSIFIGNYAGYQDTVTNSFLIVAPTNPVTSEDTSVSTTSYKAPFQSVSPVTAYESFSWTGSNFLPYTSLYYEVYPYKDVGGTFYYDSSAYAYAYAQTYSSGTAVDIDWTSTDADGYAVVVYGDIPGIGPYIAVEFTTNNYITDFGSWTGDPYGSNAPYGSPNYIIPTFVNYRIYSYVVSGGTTYYSSNYLQKTHNSFTQDGSGVDISWDAVFGATGYKVLRSVNGGAYSTSATTLTTSIDDDDDWTGDTTVTPLASVSLTGDTSVAIGRYAGTGGYTNSIAIGRGVVNSATTQANIGNVFYLDGIYASDTQSSTPIATSKMTMKGGQVWGYVAKTANYTVLPTDYTIDCTANTFTVTLPTAVGATGQVYHIKNSGTGTITVDGNGTQTIDGQLTQTLNQYDSLTIVSNGANWIII